jgi:hypothetical protein
LDIDTNQRNKAVLHQKLPMVQTRVGRARLVPKERIAGVRHEPAAELQ